MTTVPFMAINGVLIMAITGDGILVGTIGVSTIGSLTITIRGTILIATTAVTTIMDTQILDTTVTTDVRILMLMGKDNRDIETQV